MNTEDSYGMHQIKESNASKLHNQFDICVDTLTYVKKPLMYISLLEQNKKASSYEGCFYTKQIKKFNINTFFCCLCNFCCNTWLQMFGQIFIKTTGRPYFIQIKQQGHISLNLILSKRKGED